MRAIISGLICLCLGVKTEALPAGTSRPPTRGAELSGKVEHGIERHRDTLAVFYVEDSLEGEEAPRTMDVVTDEKGRFRFRLPCNGLMKVSIWDKSMGFVLVSLNSMIVEPGDDIGMLVDVRTGPAVVRNAGLSGKGSGKYKCIQALDLVRVPGIFRALADRRITVLDSLMSLKERILNSYRTIISPRVWRILRADAVGRTAVDFLKAFLPDVRVPLAEDSAWYANTWETFHRVREFMRTNYRVRAAEACYAGEYMTYLYMAEKYSVWQGEGAGHWEDGPLYAQIIKNYNGLLRDRLLWVFIKDHYVLHWQGEDLEDLHKALRMVENSNIKDALRRLYRVADRGRPYEFILPRDSSDSKVALSGFKGKVVLLDMWAYFCSGCILFSKVFHEKIFPALKSDTNFVMVSIMMGEDTNRAPYIHRLRGEDASGRSVSFRSTEPEYINLFSPGGETRKIREYYKQDAAPLLVLIDKSGRVVKTTQTGFPFFISADSPNVKILLDLIHRELSK